MLTKHVYVSPHEQKIFDELAHLNKMLNDFEENVKIQQDKMSSI